MVFFFVFVIVMLLFGVFFAALVIRSKNPDNLTSLTAELTKKKDFRNYRLRNRSVANAVEYTYTYRVNGKSYHLRGVQHTHSRNLRERITVVYLRNFPHCAYEECFSGITEWLCAISFTAMGAFLILLYCFVS